MIFGNRYFLMLCTYGQSQKPSSPLVAFSYPFISPGVCVSVGDDIRLLKDNEVCS